MYEVTSFESKIGGIILDSSQIPENKVTIKVNTHYLIKFKIRTKRLILYR